ncbi:hypothetical protein OBBRIDRAFT_799101 [Obba rivulosa]|uniref:Uncharacterized protein n=1 Tax=Obba rivulosa TaxID=1052685 RepID=A0A8E2DJ56_9APHY|nr:hypothetical protein OBBRIDRAFT_799101 [Obba rivulosa]
MPRSSPSVSRTRQPASPARTHFCRISPLDRLIRRLIVYTHQLRWTGLRPLQNIEAESIIGTVYITRESCMPLATRLQSDPQHCV